MADRDEFTSIDAFPKRDRNLDSFRMWAAQHFDDELRDPLRRTADGVFYHQRVNDAWQAWKTASDYVARENEFLRKRIEEISKHTLQMPIFIEPKP